MSALTSLDKIKTIKETCSERGTSPPKASGAQPSSVVASELPNSLTSELQSQAPHPQVRGAELLVSFEKTHDTKATIQ